MKLRHMPKSPDPSSTFPHVQMPSRFFIVRLRPTPTLPASTPGKFFFSFLLSYLYLPALSHSLVPRPSVVPHPHSLMLRPSLMPCPSRAVSLHCATSLRRTASPLPRAASLPRPSLVPRHSLVPRPFLMPRPFLVPRPCLVPRHSLVPHPCLVPPPHSLIPRPHPHTLHAAPTPHPPAYLGCMTSRPLRAASDTSPLTSVRVSAPACTCIRIIS